MSGKPAILSLNLNTFIRYYSLDPSKRMAEVSRRMQNRSGYDYYHILAKAVEAKASGATADEIEYILNNTSNPSESSHNRAAYQKFFEKFGRKRGLDLFERKGSVKLCGGQLIIYVNPLFSVQSSKGFDVYSIWASQTLSLDRARAGVGVHLMNVAFRKIAPNYNYKMFSASDGKIYSAVNNTTPKAIDEIALSIVSTASEA
jgi:hypothetical protein